MNNIEELKEPVKNSELHINAQNYPEGCYEELEKLKKEYQSQYADIESKYTIEKLKEAGYINAALQFAAGHFIDGTVSCITYSGHEYLDNIRELGVWRKVKAMLKNAGATTLPLISQAAQMLIGSQLTVN